MRIKEDHKVLLKNIGLSNDDFKLFDGRLVRYEYDEKKGVRIYDPYYNTSYNEYIGIDGWSAWSEENDTFMSNILKMAEKKDRGEEINVLEAKQKKVSESLKKKFGGKIESESE